MTTYKMVELKDGEPVQYLGVYVTRWTSEMGEPTVGFVEDDEVEILRARVAELEAAILETGGTFYHEIYGDTCIFCDRTDRKHEDDCIYNQLRVKARQPLPQPPEEVEG